MEIQKGEIIVELDHDCYEGWNGIYNPGDPEDEPLLRFTVYRLGPEEREEIDDASYCTRLSNFLPDEKKMLALQILLNEVYDFAEQRYSIKKLCETLSWIGPDWLEKEGGYAQLAGLQTELSARTQDCQASGGDRCGIEIR